MTINQISIFLENKYGKLNELLTLLSQENIRIFAATVADTSEFGILRMIVSDAQKAHLLLRRNNVNVNLTEVLAIAAKPSADSFAGILSHFTRAGLSIEYMYCFSSKENSVMVLRTNNNENALDVIRRQNLKCITENDLMQL
jgi:hypothetical protein